MAVDPKTAGEQADQMIAELNRRNAEEQAANVGAISENAEGDVSSQPDVSIVASTAQPVESSELALLRREVETANQRWSVLQGMVNKKDTEIEQMRVLLAQVNQKVETPAARPAVDIQADEEAYGDGIVGMISRRALEAVLPKLDGIMARITELEKSIKGVSDVSARTSAELFDDALERQVPGWRSVNVDPAFITWLNEEEGLTGIPRLEFLKDAYSRGDLAKTAKFFKAFGNDAPETVTPKNVTKLVAPGKSKSSITTPTPAGQKQIWSKSDISRLYDDKRNGRITQALFDEYESDLFKAQVEGRLAA